MDKVAVSVIICVRNGKKVIGRQLAALSRQVGAPDFEVIVVDNGSTDGTKEYVERWQGEEGCHLASLRVVDGGRAPGIPRARNLGVLAARGELLAFCDADDEVFPGWVAALNAAVTGDQLAGGRIRARNGIQEEPNLFGRGLMATSYLPHVGNGNCAIRRSVFLEVGGYDESLPRYGFEDVDFSWRVQEAGHPIIYVDDAEIWFSISSSGTQVRKKFWLGVGRVLMARRFPAYDGRAFTIPTAFVQCGQTLWAVFMSSLRGRTLNRRGLSVWVASAGQLWGTLRYRGLNRLPPRSLIKTRGRSDGA